MVIFIIVKPNGWVLYNDRYKDDNDNCHIVTVYRESH